MSAVWSWQGGGEFRTYDSETSTRIEEAFQRRQSEVRIRINGSAYVIDFQKMRQARKQVLQEIADFAFAFHQVSVQNEKKWRAVRRSEGEADRSFS